MTNMTDAVQAQQEFAEAGRKAAMAFGAFSEACKRAADEHAWQWRTATMSALRVTERRTT